MERKNFTREEVMTALIVWETMNERFRDEAYMKTLDHQDPWADMTICWENNGVYEMRSHAIDIGLWIEKAYAYLVRKMGPEPLTDLGVDAYDFEFVPLIMEQIDWEMTGPKMKPAKEAASVLVAKLALNRRRTA